MTLTERTARAKKAAAASAKVRSAKAKGRRSIAVPSERKERASNGVYKRGAVWWFKFSWKGDSIRKAQSRVTSELRNKSSLLEKPNLQR